MSSTTCPTNALPEDEDLGKPIDLPFVVAPRGNTTANDIPDPWMVSCCEPASVQIVSANLSTWACWQWCALPPRYTGRHTNETFNTSRMTDEFESCVTSSESYINASVKPNIFHVSSSAPKDGLMGDGMVGLAMVLGFAVWRLFM